MHEGTGGIAVGETTAQEGPGHVRDAVRHQDRARQWSGHSGDLLEQGHQVAHDRAGCREQRQAQREHRQDARRQGLTQAARAGQPATRNARNHRDEQPGGGDREPSDHEQRPAPPEDGPGEHAQRQAEHGRDREPGDDDRQGPTDALRRDDRGRCAERRGQKQALERSGREPGGDEPSEVRQGRRSDDQDREHGHRADENRPPVPPDGRRRQQRPADGEAERVHAEQRAGGRDRHPETGGDLRQQARGQQFGRAGHEGAEQQADQHDTAVPAAAEICREGHEGQIRRAVTSRYSQAMTPSWMNRSPSAARSASKASTFAGSSAMKR